MLRPNLKSIDIGPLEMGPEQQHFLKLLRRIQHEARVKKHYSKVNSYGYELCLPVELYNGIMETTGFETWVRILSLTY